MHILYVSEVQPDIGGIFSGDSYEVDSVYKMLMMTMMIVMQ